MTKPGQKQRPTVHKVAATVSPDDVRYLELQRDEVLKSDRRTDADKYLGVPPFQRSALFEYQQRQAQRSQPAAGGSATASSMPHAKRG